MDIIDVPRASVVGVYGPCGSGKTRIILDAVTRTLQRDRDAIAAVCVPDAYYSNYEALEAHADRCGIFEVADSVDVRRTLLGLMTLCSAGAPLVLLAVPDLTSIPHASDVETMDALLIDLRVFATQHNVTVLLGCDVRREFMTAGSEWAAPTYTPTPKGVRGVADYIMAVDRGQAREIQQLR